MGYSTQRFQSLESRNAPSPGFVKALGRDIDDWVLARVMRSFFVFGVEGQGVRVLGEQYSNIT